MEKYLWTQRDTEICERAEASGLAVDKYTGKLMSFSDLQEMAIDYDRVRDIMSIDEFMDKRIISVPFEDKEKYDRND
jgi:hypothetical protein